MAKARALNPLPSEDDIIEKIEEYLSDNKHKVIARRVERRLNITLNPSIKSKEISTIEDFETLKKKMKEVAQAQISKANKLYSEEEIEIIIEEEAKRIDEALDSKDSFKMLKYAPGKQLINRLLHFAGCNSDLELIEAARKLNVISEVQPIMALKEKLISELN